MDDWIEQRKLKRIAKARPDLNIETKPPPLRVVANPKIGEIWYSPLIGYRVRIVGIGADRRIYVSDGKYKTPVLASHFDDPSNGWKCVGHDDPRRQDDEGDRVDG